MTGDASKHQALNLNFKADHAYSSPELHISTLDKKSALQIIRKRSKQLYLKYRQPVFPTASPYYHVRP